MTTLVLNTELKQRMFQAMQLKSALNLYNATGGRIIVTRGATPKRLLAAASATTGKPYKNTEKGRESAIADLQAFLDENSGVSLAPSAK